MLHSKTNSLILVIALSIVPSITHANRIAWDIFTGVVSEVTGNLVSDLLMGDNDEFSKLESDIRYLQNNIQSYAGENHSNYREVSLVIKDIAQKLGKLDGNLRSMERRLAAMELNMSLVNAQLRINTSAHGIRSQDIEIYDKARPSPRKPVLKKNLNMLIFNASTSSGSHAQFAKEIKSEYPTSVLSKQLNWIDKFVMKHTLIFYQGAENRRYAEEIAAWLPGKQVVRDYINNPGGFFGFNKERDLIFFIGQDHPTILRYLK